MSLNPVPALIATQGLRCDVALAGKLPAPAARARQTDPSSAAWCRDAPASTAWTTRSRRATDRAEDIGALLRRLTPEHNIRFIPRG